jgi:hypothetical protein
MNNWAYYEKLLGCGYELPSRWVIEGLRSRNVVFVHRIIPLPDAFTLRSFMILQIIQYRLAFPLYPLADIPPLMSTSRTVLYFQSQYSAVWNLISSSFSPSHCHPPPDPSPRP